MGRTSYSEEGLKELAEIVKRARGTTSGRAFAKIVGVSYATISRWEAGALKEPEIGSLEKFAKVTGYTTEELIAVCQGNKKDSTARRIYLIAEDVIPAVEQLPDIEAARLAQSILSRFISPTKAEHKENKGRIQGAKSCVDLMDKKQIAGLLRAIADQVEQSQ